MGKKVSKIVKKSLGLGLAGGLLGDDSAEKEAKRAQEALAAQQRQMEQQQRQLQENMAVDLSGENLADVVAGGSAEFQAAESDPKRKRRVGGLSSALGVPQ
jgi:type II secretory pathway pseudopilin PulG